MKPQITIVKVDELSTREELTWSYPLDELDYILERVENGDYEENELTFYLYKGRIYESFVTPVGL